MHIANAVRQMSLLLLLIAAIHQPGQAGAQTSAPAPEADKLPAFESMLATALQQHPQVRAAQAELGRVRLEVANEIRAFRDEWQSQQSKIAAAETAMKNADRLLSLPAGAVADSERVEAEQRVRLSRDQANQAQAKIKELKATLPLLLGSSTAAGPRNEADGQERCDERPLSAPVKELLSARLQLLAEIAALRRAAYESGQMNYDAVAAAQREMLEAKLELAPSAEERIVIRREMRQIALELEKFVADRFQAQEATQAEILNARALSLRAEADLAQEQFAAEGDR